MNNNDDLLKNYLESQKRQKEILEETKKRRLENKNNKEQTKKISQNTKNEIKTAPEFLMLAETEYQNRNFKVAITFLNNAIEIDPKVANYYLRRGLAKFNLIDQQETYDFLKDDPELSKSFNIANYLDVISDKNLDYQSAIDDYDKAIEIDPSDAAYYYFRGIAKEKLKDYENAIDDYTKALEINPRFGNAFFHRARSKMYLNDFDGAITDYTKAIENPKDEYRAKNQFIYLDRANAKFTLKDYQGAIDDCNKAIELEPEFANALYIRGRAKTILKDYEGAIDDYDKAIGIDPNESDEFYFYRAIAKFTLKDYQGAIDDCNKAIEIDPSDADYYYFRASSKDELEDYQGAIDDCNKALEIDPNNNSYSRFLADAKRKTRKLENSKEEDQNLLNQNKVLLNIQKVKGKYLGVVNDKLSKEYSENEIAIACGYFEIKNKIKVPLVKEYLEESLKSKEELRQLKSNYSTEDYYLKYIELDIFKGRLCEHDEDHGGILYVPKRIVENSKDWDYQKADLENFDMEYVEYEDGLEDFESNISEKYTEDQIKELDMEKEFLEFYGFSEPMMFTHVSLMYYVDHHLSNRHSDYYFEPEDIAEAYGIRYQDIHEKSFFA